MVARVRSPGPQAQSHRARRGASRHRGPADRQPASGSRPPGRAGDQPGRRGLPEGRATSSGCAAAGVDLVALFSPEHGFRGAADPGAAVASSHRFRHRPSNLQPLRPDVRPDRLDAGRDRRPAGGSAGRRRALLHLSVHDRRGACGRRRGDGIPVVVLDRPNPIGGAVQGNVLDTAFASPVGLLAVPMRHGMTLGELARLARDRSGPRRPISAWCRSRAGSAPRYFDETGLPFVPPSPNLRSSRPASTIRALCLFEGTKLSVGRGTDAPFEQIGAPWLDTAAVLDALRAARPAGVQFAGVTFTPRAARATGSTPTPCVAGIRLRVTDRDVLRPRPPTAVAPAGGGRVRSDGRDSAGSPRTSTGWPADRDCARRSMRGTTPAAIVRGLGGRASQRFQERRRPFLLYPE